MATSTRIRPSWARERSRPAHGAIPAAGHRRRRPTATPLYPIVQHHLETFLARAAEADPWGEDVADWVEEDFRAYLRCGILAHGFASVRCDDCAAERLVAFSSKGRGVCPSCNARRMWRWPPTSPTTSCRRSRSGSGCSPSPKRIRPFFHLDPALA